MRGYDQAGLREQLKLIANGRRPQELDNVVIWKTFTESCFYLDEGKHFGRGSTSVVEGMKRTRYLGSELAPSAKIVLRLGASQSILLVLGLSK